jgi:hypothetical protein
MSFIFMCVMMIGVFGDLWTRADITLPSAHPTFIGPE